MSRTCTACSHTLRLKIDQAIALGKSNRAIASKFGLTRSAVQRHKPHVAEAIERAAEKRKLSIGKSILDRLENLYQHCQTLFDKAKAAKNFSAAVACIREQRGIVESLDKVREKMRPKRGYKPLPKAYINAVNRALGFTGKLIPIGTPPSQAEENGSDGESTIDILPD